MIGVENNPPEIDLLFNKGEIEIDPTKTWIMAESRSSYFEAYKHTLRALQRMREHDSPLYRHLAFLDRNIQPPEYVSEEPVMKLTPCFPDHPDKAALWKIDILQPWPKDITTSMDSTQIEALKRILTKSLAIVQGPPGTGKTFTSVQALKTILENMKTGDPPIVIACQTNHALGKS